MKSQISNPSLSKLLEALVDLLTENGYSQYVIGQANLFARQLDQFMESNSIQLYDETTGERFFEDYRRHHKGKPHLNEVKVFVARLNAILRKEGFLACRKRSVPDALPPEMENLVIQYLSFCAKKGLRPKSIEKYDLVCRRFLKVMTEDGVRKADDITTATVSRACLLISNYYLDEIQAFLRYLWNDGIVKRDYSFLVPHFRRPQPAPSVYSIDEIRRMEATADCRTPCGKRNYAILLLTTRLGIRPSDIAKLTFDELDFEHGIIRFQQRKTTAYQELPMLPVIRNALMEYIRNARGDFENPCVFLQARPPYGSVTRFGIWKIVKDSIRKAGINAEFRDQGSRAIRSSVASSMVNDNVPYDAVRGTLGHHSANAIKSYAKVDVEQLKLYALDAPAATGNFAEFLAGRL